MLNIIWSIIAGLIIGLLAKFVVPGRQSIPLWLTILLGIVGALIGNWLAAVFGVRFTGGVDWIRHILQVGARGRADRHHRARVDATGRRPRCLTPTKATTSPCRPPVGWG